MVHPPFPFRVFGDVPQAKALPKTEMLCVGEEEGFAEGLAPQIPSFLAGSIGLDPSLAREDTMVPQAQ